MKNMEGNTALIFAVHTMGHAGITKLLIESGADVSAENNENETPLMYASWNGKKDTVKLLLANGANVDKKNKNGDTALVLAETKGHTHIIRLLKNAGSK
jgi:ankyrin repeat protein